MDQTIAHLERARELVNSDLNPRILTCPVGSVILDRVAELLLSDSSQPCFFEEETLAPRECIMMDSRMCARQDLANMCLVHSSWLVPAQRVLQSRLVLLSNSRIHALMSSKNLARWVKSLCFGGSFARRTLRPLTNVLGHVNALRLLSIDLNFFKPKNNTCIFAAEMATLVSAVGQLQSLEGLIIFNIKRRIWHAFLKSLFLGIRELRELRYIGLGLLTFIIAGEYPVVTFSPEEISGYYNPPKLNTVAIWSALVKIPELFLDGHRRYSPESGPDVFELRHPYFDHRDHLTTAPMELLKARRLFALGFREVGETPSPTPFPLIEELFTVILHGRRPFQPDVSLSRLLSNGLPKLRSVRAVYAAHSRDEEFPESSALCMDRGCKLVVSPVPWVHARRIDELLFLARSL